MAESSSKNRTRLHRLCSSVLWLAFAAPATAATLENVRVADAPDYTRLVLDVSEPVEYSLFTLENPHRVVIDLPTAQPRSGLKLSAVEVAQTRIGVLRGGPRGERGYRIVLEVGEQLLPVSAKLTPRDGAGDRVVVDLYGAQPGGGSAVAPAAAPPRSPPRTAVTQTKGQVRNFIVAIDAGHGGGDPGAIGVGKVQEKKVALAIAQELDRLFDAARGYRGELVRRGDYYLTLRQRTEVARRQRADLFISIHADAFSSATARGASVYTLSEKGATSETARWLAEKENASDLIGGAGDVSLDDKDAVLAHVLLDLSMDGNRSISIETGTSVLASLGSVTQLHGRRRVEQAGFMVLKSPDIPSLLVETGYLSNAAEARALAQPAYQRKIAQAIFEGVTRYVAQHPPQDTWVAQRSVANAKTKHVIKRGDTLSEIAAYYQVSRAQIRRANGLATDTIRVGQVLIIPAG